MTTEHAALPQELNFGHVQSITIDQGTQTVHVAFRAHVGKQQYPIDAKEVFALSNDAVLRGLTLHLERSITERLYTPLETPKEYKCDDCNANCCTGYKYIPVYHTDVAPLMAAVGVNSEEHLRTLGVIDGPPSVGQAGWLGRIWLQNQGARDLLNATHTCVFLTWDAKGVGRCGIYEHRPSTCRDYKERSCTAKGQPEPTLYRIRPSKDYAGAAKVWKGEQFGVAALLNKHPHDAMDHEGA